VSIKLPASLAKALKQLLAPALNPDPAPIMPKLVKELYPKLVVLYYVALSFHVVLEPVKHYRYLQSRHAYVAHQPTPATNVVAIFAFYFQERYNNSSRKYPHTHPPLPQGTVGSPPPAHDLK
jgi:hypothetical protein